MNAIETAWLPDTAWMAPLSAVAAFAGTWCMRTVALRTGHIVQPHARGSHTRPTPVGGGMGFVLPVTIAWVSISLAWGDYVLLTTALVGAAIALMGYIDDRRRIEPWIRLAAQAVAAAVIATLILWRARGPQGIEYAGYIAGAAFMLTWSANLFNFMDGIDGLCATECLYIALGGLAVSAFTGAPTPFLLALVVIAAALVGFLPWNLAPARIFMGDGGSTWLGFTLAALAIQDSVRLPGLLSAWLILPALFVADATVCVIRRAYRGENIMQAHRAHAYQNLSRLLRSHGKVVAVFVSMNLLFLPAVYVAIEMPTYRWIATIAAYAVAAALAIAARSGVHGVGDNQCA
ncbi:MAG: glycosyltransferase family 4 protein [Phycisphaerales bacterium]|nr:glycosyltransferase family 4 protein [Phycisphaerales bacterium]